MLIYDRLRAHPPGDQRRSGVIPVRIIAAFEAIAACFRNAQSESCNPLSA
jgi:hypothetical protein